MQINIVVLNSNRKTPKTLPNPYDNSLYILDEGTKLTKVLSELHARYAKRAIEVYGGRNRNVFRMPGGYVVKVPSCFNGLTDNDWEGSISNAPENVDNSEYVQYARTRLAYYKEVPIVFMEYVEFTTMSKLIEL